jgi:hypothetical protein
VATVYIPTEAKSERSQFLKKQDPAEGKGFKVKDKEGRFLEMPDLIRKYQRRMADGENDSEENEVLVQETNEQKKKKENEIEAVEKMCYVQFAKMYETSWAGEREDDHGSLATRDEFNFVMSGEDEEGENKVEESNCGAVNPVDDDEGSKDNQVQEDEKYNHKIHKGQTDQVQNIYIGGAETKVYTGPEKEISSDDIHKEKANEKDKEDNRLELPLTIKLRDPMPGEPPYLRRRSFPKAIRFYKQNIERDQHKFYLQQLIMYRPFRDEKELFPENRDDCEKLYMDNISKIETVRAKVMPYLESVQRARTEFEESKENEEPDLEEVAAMLDPEKEQEIMEDDEEEEEDHPDYLHINPDQVEYESKEDSKRKRVFRAIEIPSNQTRLEEARKLDKMQRYVLSEGIKYAKGIVKAKKGKNKKPNPPHMMVHGGAGSGKSSVIKPLAEWIQDILQEQGDDPNSPRVVLSSFTGAASANIHKWSNPALPIWIQIWHKICITV